MQKGAAASLVRNPATPSFYANQLHSSKDLNLIDSDVQLHTLPTPKQQAALSEILVFDSEKILAWLTILRSVEPDFRYRASQGCLSYQQLDALSTLKDCSDSDILAWLSFSLLASDVKRQRTLNHTISTSRSPAVPTSRHLRRLSTNHSQRSSTSSLALSAVFSNNSSYGTPRSSLGNSTSLTQLPEGIACNDEYKHEHWCTYGEHSKPTDTCEGWKRHEREHETGYMCMPNGPVEHTQHGQICALCGEADPDADHMIRHNISICFGKFKAPLKKTRRTDMIRHLAQHHVHSEDAAVLAEQWRYDSKKKYFSCGLCVGIFFSIKERSNHIDNEHWRHGQNMGAWELSNLIRGLLLEREVQAAWRVLLTSHPYLVESNLRWEMPLAEGLQVRLEKGEEPGLVLAKAALEHSNYERIRPNKGILMATMDSEDMIYGLGSGTYRSLAVGTVVPSSNSTYHSLHNHKQSRPPLSRLLTGSLPSSNVETSSAGFQNPQCDALYPSAFLGVSFQSDDFCNDHFLHPGPLMGPNISDLPSQVPTYACPAEWPSMDTSQPLDDHTRIQGHLSESGASLIAQMSSPRHGQPATYGTIDEQGPITDSLNENKSSIAGRLPTSTFFHGCTAQLSSHEYGFNFRKKPLPPIPPPDMPENASRVAEHRSSTPMDLGTG